MESPTREWLNLQEAEELTGKSKDTIWRWVDILHLTTKQGDSGRLYSREELIAICDAKQKDRGGFTPSRQLLALIIAKLDRLEQQIDLLQYLTGGQPPADVHDGNALDLVHTIQRCVHRVPQLTTEEIAAVAELLLGIKDAALHVVRRVTGDSQPWLLFYEATSQLLLEVRKRIREKEAHGLRKVERKLALAQRQLKMSGWIFVQADLRHEVRETLTPLLAPTTSMVDSVVERAKILNLTGARQPKSAYARVKEGLTSVLGTLEALPTNTKDPVLALLACRKELRTISRRMVTLTSDLRRHLAGSVPSPLLDRIADELYLDEDVQP